jgi:hypothetical protein
MVMAEKTASVETKSKTSTNWRALEDAGVIPVRVVCQDYVPVSARMDMSCHSNLAISGENVTRHMVEEHGTGGGFAMYLRLSDGKKSKLWRELEDAGVELHDFRCDICDEQLPLQPRRIARHLQPHSGKSRHARANSKFWMTLRYNQPDELDSDEVNFNFS